MTRTARWLVVLVAGALLVAACGGGEDKLSAEECAKESAKLFDDVDDLQKISERFDELEKKGCTSPEVTVPDIGTGENGAPTTVAARAADGPACLRATADAARAAAAARAGTGDGSDLQALDARVRAACQAPG